MNLSFAGCGFLGIYHVGVACCFRKYAPHLLLDKISGASAGAIAACALLCDIPLGDMTSDVLRVATAARRYSFGPLNPKFNIIDHLQEGLDKFLPEDVHLRVNGRLHISLTRCHDGKNVLVSQFDSRQDVIDVLLASAFIPIFSGMIPPKYKGVRYMDGGYSDNLPTLDENTITVSPFCGESDICPRDDSSQLFHINVANTSIELSRHNMYRIIRILFPPDPEILATMCKQGFDDALRFLHRNNLINCTRCLAVQSTFVVSKNTLVANNVEYDEYDPQCKECITHRQEALTSSMPDTMINVFQDAINSANNGLTSWLFRHKGMKLLSVLSLPYTIPADLMFATFAKFNFLPNMKATPAMLSRKVTDFSFVSAVGDRFETRCFQHRILDNATAIFTSCTSEMRNDDARLMTAAPKITNTVWDLSKYFMDQVTYILNKVNRQRKQLNAKITCKLDVTEYDPNDVEACHDEMFAKNKMNLNFTLNYDSELEETNKHKNSNNHHHGQIERRSEVTINRPDPVDHDAFEHILQVTNQHETLMTYYYLDKNNEVKVTEILDVTESDSPIVQTSHERETNRSLEFDDEWDESTWTDQQQLPNYMYLDERRTSLTEMSEYSLEDLVLTDKDASNLFSDPESEWTGTYKVDMPEDETFQSDLMPESEQPVQLRHYVIEPLTLEE